MSDLLRFFSTPWDDVPTAWIDTETTGTSPVHDRAVQVAIVRFEGGQPVGSFSSLVHPGRAIPSEATAIHGITDEQVRDAPVFGQIIALKAVQELLEGAQPGAYNAPFDRHFVPPFGEDWTWPWLDALSVVRVVDRFARGKGRHRLELAAERHGVPLSAAHSAEADARAAGELFYKLVPTLDTDFTLGGLIKWQREAEAEEWFRFNQWLSKQSPQSELPGVK